MALRFLCSLFVGVFFLHCVKKDDKLSNTELLQDVLLVLSYPYLINNCAITGINPQGPVPAISAGYGARGTHQVSVNALQNPIADRRVCVYYPSDQTNPAPVLFLFHGFSSPSAEPYYPLIDFYVSKGYVVVFPIYFSDTRPPQQNYDIMWAGLKYAVDTYPNRIDTRKVGFMGHSYGGGATPYMAHKGLFEQSWGSSGSFMYLAAPWYSFNTTNSNLTDFTTATKLIVQVHQEDDTNDHRMAIDIFNNVTSIPSTERSYQIIYTDSFGGYTLKADHYVPIKDTIIGIGALNGLDFYGVWRQLDALTDYAFNGAGSATALGTGNGSFSMGNYPDGSQVKKMDFTRAPSPLQAESYYSQQWSNPLNPR
ncbi:alpha/beta hydrolase [Leptospira fletcheri]|uniref:Alpha/beta hydrolase n=1 Tax=Leptospira fletcheri TaxID=2484981 RepID=A0A4R9GB33_9LEPT|nr:alpha/beta hydrolase [Leptospira fletcheri]TGK08565.1 alpha/beta hydrolase [Leptospira fletcheri]